MSRVMRGTLVSARSMFNRKGICFRDAYQKVFSRAQAPLHGKRCRHGSGSVVCARRAAIPRAPSASFFHALPKELPQ